MKKQLAILIIAFVVSIGFVGAVAAQPPGTGPGPRGYGPGHGAMYGHGPMYGPGPRVGYGHGYGPVWHPPWWWRHHHPWWWWRYHHYRGY